MLLAEDDHMIKALASDRADRSFGIAVLPWRSRRCWSVANAHRSDAARKDLAVDPVPITDEIVWRALPTTCLRDLLGDPFGTRLRSDGRLNHRPCGANKGQDGLADPATDITTGSMEKSL